MQKVKLIYFLLSKAKQEWKLLLFYKAFAKKKKSKCVYQT